MATVRYKADFKGTGELMRGPEMQAVMRQLAEEGAGIARATAPVHTGEYKASIRVEVLEHGGQHGDRAEGRIIADSDHAVDVEWHDGHHTLARAVDQLGHS